jgi:hypothetical protein
MGVSNKYIFIIILSLFLFSSYGQQAELIKILSSDEIPDCEKITLEIMDEISKSFLLNNKEKSDSLIELLEFLCGKNESIQRVIIFNSILNNNFDKKDIETYLKKDYTIVLEHRKRDSKSSEFAEFYEDNKEYYGYLPLRHSIDAIITDKSKEMLKSDTVSENEKLFCTLFANDLRTFKRELSDNKYKNSITKKVWNETKYQKSLNYFAIEIESGMHSMIGNKNLIFRHNPYIGFCISTPLKNKFIWDFGMNIRFNVNDSDFLYYAMGDTNLVNSNTTQLFYLNVGYKLLDKKGFIIIPKIGAGFESTGTGLSETVEDEEDGEYVKYYSLHALNLSSGVKILRKVCVRNYLGLSVNYHFCPYQWNKKLVTQFNNNSLSCELVFRFYLE